MTMDGEQQHNEPKEKPFLLLDFSLPCIFFSAQPRALKYEIILSFQNVKIQVSGYVLGSRYGHKLTEDPGPASSVGAHSSSA